MTNEPQSRQPGDSVFATFKIPYEKWQHFQQAAQLEGKTASATLVAFIEQYLSQENAANSSPENPTASFPSLEQLEQVLQERITAHLQALSSPQIASFAEKLDQFEILLRQFDERLGKIETAMSQWKAQQYQPPNLVDVEAVAIKADQKTHTPKPDEKTSKTEIGVAERALCEQFGLNPETLLRHAQMRGLSPSEYLHQVTGWVYHHGKYYPGDVH